MDEQMLLREFELLADAPDAIPKLREMILDLAVRGRLVPQDESDKPASELLRRIEAEKQRLYEKGRNRKPKKLPPVKEEEKPFELPQGWEWARLGDVAQLSIGKTPSTKNKAYWDGDIPWVSISDLDHYGIVHNTKRTITRKAADSVFSGEIAPRGSLLMSFKLTIGKVAWLGVDAYHNEAIVSIDAYDGLSESYLFRLLPHLSTGGKTRAAIKGKTLNKSSLSKLLIPVAPNAEQRRIVAKVDELMRLCDELESRQEKCRSARVSLNTSALDALQKADREALPGRWQFVRDHFDLLYQDPQNVQKLKETILQLAVQGKLTRQAPNDEPASELLKRIEAEKQRLYEEGKIRKPKKLPPVREEEKPFELPKGWEWVRIGTVFNVSGGIQKTPRRTPRSNHYPYVGVSNVQRSTLQLGTLRRFELFDDELKKYRLEEGDLLIVEGNGSASEIGRCAMWRGEIADCVHQNHLIKCRPFERAISDWTLRVLNSPFGTSEMRERAVTTSGLYNLSVGKIQSIAFPLPPTKEQHRAVAKVSELMRLCDDLDDNLNRSEAKAERLLEAVVREGVMTVGNTETASTR